MIRIVSNARINCWIRWDKNSRSGYFRNLCLNQLSHQSKTIRKLFKSLLFKFRSGIENADELVRFAVSTPLNGPEPLIGIPKSTVKKIITEGINQGSNHLWHDRINGQETSKFLIWEFSWKMTTERLQLGKINWRSSLTY